MSDTIFDNPFKQLDKKKYKEAKKLAKAEKKPLKEDVPLQNFGSDEDLFLQTMRNVKNVKNTDKYVNTQEKKQAEQPIQTLAEQLPSQSKKSKKKALETQILSDISSNIPNNKNKEKQQVINNESNDFYKAMLDVKPLDGKERVAPPDPEQIVVQNDPSPLLHDFEEGKLEFSITQNADHVQCNILGLDILTLGKLQQRHYNPESHIDLHNLNAYQAFQNLVGFFKNAYYRDMRCVLIVTGKGLNSLNSTPILRTKVCDWLIDTPFKHLVLAFCTAKAEDGGSGALYVLIRKRRKNSQEIPWDKIPNDYDLWADLDK